MNLAGGRRGALGRVGIAVAIAALMAGFVVLTDAAATFPAAIQRDTSLHRVEWSPKLRMIDFDGGYFANRPVEYEIPRRDLATVINRLADRGARTIVLSPYRLLLRRAKTVSPAESAALPELVTALRRVHPIIPDPGPVYERRLDPALREVLTVAPALRQRAFFDWDARYPHWSDNNWRFFSRGYSEAVYAVRTHVGEGPTRRLSWPAAVVQAQALDNGRPDPTPLLPALVRKSATDPVLPRSATAYLGGDAAGGAAGAPSEDLRDTIVLLSANYGFYNETVATQQYTFEHAEVINALLEDPVAYERSGTGETALTTFVLAFVALLVMLFIRPFLGSVVLVLVLFAYALWVHTELAQHRQMLFELPLVAFFLSAAMGLGIRAWSERRSKESLQSVVDEYVPPAVALALTAERRGAVTTTPVEATVLYADVRGYTTLTGELDASDVKAALDIYYSTLGPTVADHRGVLLYYAGDGMVVTFGPPEHPAGHADAALACAMEMQRARVTVAYELGKHGLPNLAYGIGLDTGSVVIGPVGSAHLRQYTVLGEAVNIASRMCAIASAGQVCLTESTRVRLHDAPPLVDMGELQLKNVLREIQGWRIADEVVLAEVDA